MSILIQRQPELAEKQIRALEERRTFISNGLSELAEAALTIQKKGRGLKLQTEDIIHLIDSLNPKVIEQRCVEFWLNKSGYGLLPIREEAMAKAFERPAILTRLINAAKSIAGYSVEPSEYFTGTIVNTMPVVDGEKERIHKRCEIRVETEEERVSYQIVSSMADLMNRSGLNIYKAIEQAEWIGPFVTIIPKSKHSFTDKITVNRDMFKTVKHEYEAFDEGKLSD